MNERFAVRRATISSGSLADEEYVVKLVEAGTGKIRCTASLIADHLLLTAAHCLVEGGAELCAEMETEGGPSMIRVVDSFVHPAFAVLEPMASQFQNDVAVLGLALPVSLRPVELELGTGTQQGDRVRVVGYGRTGAREHDEGVKRGTEMSVSSTTDRQLTLTGSALPCVFDSGAPVLSVLTGRQLGVVSSGDAECASYATAMSVSAVSAFLEAHVQSPPATSDSNKACSVFATHAQGNDATGCSASAAPASTGGLDVSFILGLLGLQRLRRSRAARSLLS
jgi:secreted trypsin-like serine protease